MERKFKILLIDDEVVFFHKIQQGLLGEVFEITHVPSFPLGAKLVMNEVYDIILLDINLGKEGDEGLKVLPLLKKSGIPIIIVSNNKKVEVGFHAKELGADGYLNKSKYNAENWEKTILRIIDKNNKQSTPINSKIRKKKTLLFISASPEKVTRTRFDTEFKAIQKKIKEGTKRKDYKVRVILAATLEDIEVAINRYKPHLLHISAHGDWNGEIKFEKVGEKEFNPKGFCKFLLTNENLEFLFLAVCHSSRHSHVIKGEHKKENLKIIAMNGLINEKNGALLNFIKSFYDALLENYSYCNSFDKAIISLEMNNFLKDAKVPILL